MPARPTATVVGIGELLWDCFPDERRPGGAPANVAFHADQLGLGGVVCSRVGEDEPGTALLGRLEQAGLSTDHVQIDDRLPTGSVTVDTAVRDDPRYTIHEPAAWDMLQSTPELERLAAGCRAVCFGTLAQRNERARATIHRFLELAVGAVRVFDVNLRQSWYTPEVLERSLAHADVIKLNVGELGTLGELFGLDGTAPLYRARALLDHSSATMVCVTRGAGGCLLVDASGAHDEPGRPVRVVDAVGAGDAFTAAVITARLAGWPLDRTARLANAVGGMVASRAGSMPALRDEYARLRSAFESSDRPSDGE